MIFARNREAVAIRYWLQKPLVIFLYCAATLFCALASAEEPYQVDWIRQFGATSADFGSGIAADGLGNVYITGLGGGGDALLNKYDTDGELLWSRILGREDESERALGVATDSWGNVYITSETTGSLDGPFAGGRSDIFVAKYDADGRHLWSQQFGTDGIDVGNAIWADSLGNVYVTGEMQRDAFVAKLIPADVAFLPGDINADGSVDLRDFNVLKQNFGAGDATRAMGDLNGDMAVDTADFNVLKENFGTTHPAPPCRSQPPSGWLFSAWPP